MGRIPLRQWITVDDIAFILGTIENCINKWIRQYRYLADKKKDLLAKGMCTKDTKLLDIRLDRTRTPEMRANKVRTELETVKQFRGAKYDAGSGIAGSKGQARIAGLKVFIYRSYFDNTDEARENTEALNAALCNLAQKDLERQQNANEGSRGTTHKSEQSLAQEPPPLLETIRKMEFESLFAEDGSDDLCQL